MINSRLTYKKKTNKRILQQYGKNLTRKEYYKNMAKFH